MFWLFLFLFFQHVKPSPPEKNNKKGGIISCVRTTTSVKCITLGGNSIERLNTNTVLVDNKKTGCICYSNGTYISDSGFRDNSD